MDDPTGLIEFRYPDGRTGRSDNHVPSAAFPPRRGDILEHEGVDWAMYDREDRGGVVVYLFKPAG